MVSQEKQLSNNNKCHFIFALDDSGSMYYRKWEDLMTSFKTAINKLIIQNTKNNIKISILI